jgi:hypothetical protein
MLKHFNRAISAIGSALSCPRHQTSEHRRIFREALLQISKKLPVPAVDLTVRLPPLDLVHDHDVYLAAYSDWANVEHLPRAIDILPQEWRLSTEFRGNYQFREVP